MEQLAIDLYNPKLNVHKALTGKSRKDYTHDYNTNQVRNYNNRMCNYNGELVSFCALRTRFYRSGIPNASEAAKSYLI